MTEVVVNLPGLKLKNPLMPASGTFGFGDTPAAQKFDLNQMGALVLKTTTKKAKIGNPQPQIKVLDNGVLNSVGLTNPGVDQVVEVKLTELRKKYPDLPIIASVGGETIDDYLYVAEKLASSQMVNALEINVSCPNVKAGGMQFGIDPKIVEDLTAKIKQIVNIPIYVKLTPNVTDVVMIAKAAEAGGADGLSLINTLLGLDIDVRTRKAVLGNGMGGLSGNCIRPVALRMVYQIRQETNLPIIGMGGIRSVTDVVKFFLAGANAVAIGSAHFRDELIIPHLAEELPHYLDKLGVSDINDLVGQVDL